MKTTGNRISILWRLVIVSGAFACAFTAGYAGANGTNPTVVAGQADFSAQGSALTITNSPGTIINWQGFSIGAGESTRFIQQSSTSSVLNRVLGSDPSVILGTLTSNGRVFLINPGGILFGQGSRIDVAGLVASTLPLSNQDFLAGKLNFTANPLAGQVENQGSITTPSGGSVYLVGTDVTNSGIINSPRGDILLAAGHSVNILDSSTPGVRVEITASGNAAVNLGEILAQSGEIGIYGAAIRNSGIINADQIEQDASGRITLRAKREVNLEAGSTISADATTAGNGGDITVWSDDIANIAGTITARGGAHSGDGGFIETSGTRLSIAESTRINTLAPYGETGTWLLDPTDFTIAASGGDMTATTLATNLLSSDVTILSSGGLGGTNGDINVNEAVVWDRSAYAFPATVLTLNAVHDVNINTAITATKGSVTANAGHNINVNAAITTTDGNVVLRADSDGTGPGVDGGTITFIPAGSVTTTRGAVEMYFNPVSYAATQAEIDAYLPRITISDGTKNAYALVFAQGSDKIYDGTYTAALSFIGSPTDGGDVSLVVPVAGATFSDRNAANGKTINFTGVTLGGTNSGRFSLFGGGSGATTADIAQRPLTVTAVTETRTYNGTNASAGAPTHAALQSGDTLTTFTQTFDTVNAGSGKTLTPTGVVNDGNSGNNYIYSYVTDVTGRIDPRPLTATVTAPDKVYNGNNTASPTLSIISGLISGETVTATGTATFNSKDVLAANLVTVNSATLADGTGLASNYSLAVGQTATAHITPAALTATVTTPDKVYNGTTTAAPTLSITAGLVSGETVTASGTATFNSKDVLTANLVTVTGTALADGTGLASNYSLGTGQTATAHITPAALTATVAAPDKVYNGTTTAAPTLSIIAGLVSGETVTATGTAAFNSKDVLAANLVTVTSTTLADGTGLASNYSLTSGQTATAHITPAALTATVAAPDKVYNGTATAAPTLSITSGLVSGETVTATGTATFNSKDVLTANLVTVNSATLADGSGLASNYSLATGQTATAHITPAALTATMTAPDKVYNGNTAAAPTLSITGGLVSGETVTATGTATFNSKDVLAANLVTVNSATLADGSGLASNYSLAAGQTATAHITPAALAANVTAPDKEYNGTTTAAPTLSITGGLVSGETVTASGTATFNSKDVLAANLVTVTSTALADGTGLASNYSLAAGQTATAHITPAALTATVAAPDKIYNGTTTAAPTLSITGGLISGETVNATGTATFNSKDVLAANLVTVTSTALADGSGLASNYSLAAEQTATAHITPATLTATATAPDKIYNGTTTAAPTLSITGGLVSGETVTASGTATFNSKDVLAANLVTVTSTTLADGTGLASNYSLAAGQTATAHITPATLTATVTAPDKVYNGNTTAAPTLSITAGLISGETVTASGTATFNSKDVLAANLVTVNSATLADGSGLASNYSLASGQTATAHITPATLTATVAAPDKVYNGNTTAAPTLSITAGLISGETLTATGTATFNSKDVLAANLVTVNSAALADGSGLASNYSLATGQTATAHITPAALTVTVAAPDKVYNGNTTAAPTLSIATGLVSGETVTATGTATYNSKDVLAANLVTVDSTVLADGSGLASNYSLATGQTVTAHITPATLTATVTAPDKVYNGDNVAAPTLSVTAGLISGETVTATGTATFNSKDVLAANLVTVDSTVLADGSGLASNYSLATGQTVTAHITPAALTATVAAPDKVYNGDNVAAPTLNITAGLISGETVTATGTATYNSKDVLAANLVTVNSTALVDGTGLASNYSLAAGQTATAHITPAALTATVTAPDKVYNGTTTAAPTLSITAGLVSGETLTASGTATFNSKDVLAANLVTVNSTALADGSGLASNYSLASGQTATAHITPATLTATMTAPDKVYNGNSGAAPTLSITAGLVSGETVTATGTATFNSKDVLTANLVTVNSTALADGSGLASNYSLASGQTATAHIASAPLGIAANSATRLYGDANPAFNATYSGFQNGESAATLTGALAFTTSAVPTSNVGNYAITPGGQSSSNYSISYVNGALGITPAPLGIAANSSSKIYGDMISFIGNEFSSNGLKNGETIGSVSLSSTGAAATAGVTASPYSITASSATGGTFRSGNYTITYVNGALGVTPAALGIAANSSSKIYGDTLSFTGNEFSSSGLKNGETIGSVNLTSTGAAASADVADGPYGITASAATGGTFNPVNYRITYVDGSLGVIPAGLLGIAANSATKIYDGLAYSGGNSVNYTGFKAGDSVASLDGTLTYGGSSQGAVNVGSYAIIPSGQSSPNYTITYVNGNLGVIPAPLGIAANSTTRLYGDSNPAFSATYSGFKNGETTAALGGALAFITSAVPASNVGSYTITPGGQSSSNYTITYVNGALGVTPAPLGIAADSSSKIYGATTSFTGSEFSSSGLKNGETIGSISLTSAGAAAAAGVTGSPYSITASDATGGTFNSGNYAISYVDGSLGVTPAQLNITANNASRQYGESNPAFNATYSGFQNGEHAAALAGAPTFATSATPSSNAGSYAITPGGQSSANYTITYANGALQVTPVSLSVSAGAGSKVYGTNDPALTFSVTGLVNNPALGVTDTPGSVFSGALTRANGETVTGGPYTISQGSLTANSNYTVSSFTGSSFIITPAPLTVAADQQSKLFGTPDPALTFSATGLVNNTALGIDDSASSVLSGALTRDPGESALGGPYPITQGTIAASGNYALAFTGNNFIITGAAAEPVLGFNAEQVVFAGVVNREYYYRPGNFWHISLNPDNADPGFDVMRGTSDFNQRETRRLNRCDSVFRGGFCETMSFPQQLEREGDL